MAPATISESRVGPASSIASHDEGGSGTSVVSGGSTSGAGGGGGGGAAANDAEAADVLYAQGLNRALRLPFRQRTFVPETHPQADKHVFHRLRAQILLEKNADRRQYLQVRFAEEKSLKFETNVNSRESDVGAAYGKTAGWSVDRAIREYIQNLLDEVHTANGASYDKLRVEVYENKARTRRLELVMNDAEILAEIAFGRTVNDSKHYEVLEFVNYGVGPSRRIFKLGESTKTKNPLVLGAHGDGMKLATFTLLRKRGVHVTFESSFATVEHGGGGGGGGANDVDARQPTRTVYKVDKQNKKNILYSHTFFTPTQRDAKALKRRGHLDIDRFVVRITAPLASATAMSVLPRATISDYMLPMGDIARLRAMALPADVGCVLPDVRVYGGKVHVVHMYLFTANKLVMGYDFPKIDLDRDRNHIDETCLRALVATALEAAVVRDDEYGQSVRQQLLHVLVGDVCARPGTKIAEPYHAYGSYNNYESVEYVVVQRRLLGVDALKAIVATLPANIVVAERGASHQAVENAQSLGKTVLKMPLLYEAFASGGAMTVSRLFKKTKKDLMKSDGKDDDDEDDNDDARAELNAACRKIFDEAGRICYGEQTTLRVVSKRANPMNVVHDAKSRVVTVNTVHAWHAACTEVCDDDNGGGGNGGGAVASSAPARDLVERRQMYALYLIADHLVANAPVEKCSSSSAAQVRARLLLAMRSAEDTPMGIRSVAAALPPAPAARQCIACGHTNAGDDGGECAACNSRSSSSRRYDDHDDHDGYTGGGGGGGGGGGDDDDHDDDYDKEKHAGRAALHRRGDKTATTATNVGGGGGGSGGGGGAVLAGAHSGGTFDTEGDGASRVASATFGGGTRVTLCDGALIGASVEPKHIVTVCVDPASTYDFAVHGMHTSRRTVVLNLLP